MEQEVIVADEIDALLPRGSGHQFVFYGDACSGVPDGAHEATFARTNDVIRRLSEAPEFVVFAGDEIVGLTTSEVELRAQWSHWLDVEMGWLDRSVTPLYNTTSNHTTYGEMSERVFADVLGHLPRNGPAGQEGLSYFVRRRDLLLVFVHTSWSALGGEGHVETDWLAAVLRQHADARFKLVVGHHPAFPVNGFSGEHQRQLGRPTAQVFWDVLVRNGVDAYLCSHILAFDVQVHRGVLQIVSAGAGTAHRMPPESEYLHAVQASIDVFGLRYHVLDQAGEVRERLSWPPTLPDVAAWRHHSDGSPVASIGPEPESGRDALVAWRVSGTTGPSPTGHPRTLLATLPDGNELPSIWVGFTGVTQRLTIMLAPAPGRSPHYWFGPSLERSRAFDLQIALHFAMGPGGLLWRLADDAPWSSLTSSSPWGLERIAWPSRWTLGWKADRFEAEGLDTDGNLVISHVVA